MLTSPNLALDGIAHGFLTRRGGVSDGIYGSLNCGPGSADTAEAVAENRRRAVARIGLASAGLATLYQVHGAVAVTVEEAFAHDARPKADAMVTDRPGLALGILTADCAPLLFADPEAGVVGAAHAGWQGALAGVAQATVAAMEKLGARRHAIRAAVGPAIAQSSYEVGPEFAARFRDADPGFMSYFRPSRKPGSDRLHFDLTGFVGLMLRRAGIAAPSLLRHDTYGEADRFFSYRRTTHAGEPDYGRQISLIALKQGSQ
ncbi:peptidoglycan editing factor PgeF [Oceanibacterium hippocampi]|uniref:Purine nucleoside phosphorylase n=1 Tax=Oceanibacterium hippocampi TaxID=745714 RepID=A0A1Y5TVU2_9PROT|nr:peptidoglycan editing factor PgeF [Oceanibacterium hippocampi]SLN74518.1 Laccase domain protein YfiH [Oceanibacterium hippocampi]